jgi:CheY-like chemotaxis protein
MSHEIRTPMTAILGFTDLLCDPSMADSARLDHVSTIRRNAQHLLSIINDLLDISKIEAGRMEVESIDCAPTEIIASVASLMRAAASAKGVLLKVEYAGPMPASIRSDPTRLRQILLNLVGNAVKFTQHGSILIRASTQFTPESPSGEMQVDITDTGIGMNEAAIAKLFMPFSQADESMARRFGGTGLGLTISKKLSQMLGGDIEGTSTPGTGSTFSLRVLTGSLAAARWIERPTEAIIQTPTAASPSPLHLKARVLLAEDGPDNQRLICFHLKRAGIEVTAVTDGQQAVDATLRAQEQASPFSVILMDMQMPILDGYSATRKLRSLGYTGPIVALTAHAMAEDRQKCLDAGCDDYAAKPIDAANLIATCERWCTQARSDASRANAA